jgi:hypothetical protein
MEIGHQSPATNDRGSRREDRAEVVDVDMTELTEKMSELESSLSFVPRGVRKRWQP